MMNSKLPNDILGKIWDLSDMDKDGSLDRAEFSIVSASFIRKSYSATYSYKCHGACHIVSDLCFFYLCTGVG